MNNDIILNAIHEFLSNHYVTDCNNMYRLDYSKEFLKFGLKSPNYKDDLNLGLLYVTQESFTIVGFISGSEITLNINKDINLKSVVINFLCVHTQLRNKNLAPLLIKEITKRSIFFNNEIALYTASKRITKPFNISYHSNIYLNQKKLKECLFIPERSNFTITNLLHAKSNVYYKVRSVNKDDVDVLFLLLNDFVSKYKVYQTFSREQISHMFINNKCIHTRLMIEMNTNQIIGMFSIYNIPSKLLFDNKHSHINFSNLYYYYYNKNYISVNHIIKEAVILSKKYDYDVLTFLNNMDNKYINPSFVHYTTQKEDNNYDCLYYYLYNYILNDIKSEELGLLLF